jgi:hypothetical protein
MRRLYLTSHAATERGPRAVPRRGSDCAAPRCARGSLRCSRHKGGCDAARSGAERAAASWLLAGPALRSGLPLASLRFSPAHTSPQRGTALAPVQRSCPSAQNTVVPCKAVVGCASAATLGGAEEASPDANSPADCSCLASGQSARTGAACKARARGRARATGASTSDSRRLFEHSERSESSEFRRGPRDRAPEGIRSAAEDAAHERRRIPGRGFALRDFRAGDQHRRREPPWT